MPKTITLQMLFNAISQCATEHNVTVHDVTIHSVKPGHIHKCEDEPTKCRDFNNGRRITCGTTFDNADMIIDMQYNKKGHRAVYGVLDGEISCWMD
jgi:hypothetical protein